MEKFNFDGLFILDMANNHQGSLSHGFWIIRLLADVAKKHKIRAAIKFQFRDKSLYHPDHIVKSNNKHIPRFLSTFLPPENYSYLANEVEKENLITMCTPFDEASVDLIEQLGISIIKVASCSALDWPLLERISKANKPVIFSTGGLSINEIDSVVSFFWRKDIDFALEHCVAIYPTPDEAFSLNQISIMKNRYKDITIGFSTHEEPDNFAVIGLAYALGARMFEKHVGIATDEITLNKYSATPAQVDAWLIEYKRAVSILGFEGEREISEKEKTDLESLMRGVYAKKEIKSSSVIKASDVFFAMPLVADQLKSGQWKDGLVADKDYGINEPICEKILPQEPEEKRIILSVIHAVRGMLNEAKIPIGLDFHVELSHHYGIKRIKEVGCVIIEVINRDYGKKLLIQLPGQRNPEHYHKKKEETFQILYGKCWIEAEGRRKYFFPGEIFHMPRGVMHSFGTELGVIFEEISTKSFAEDSYYQDKDIADIPREQRKTFLHNWGKRQFD